ncbi:MAG TPA: hypothetical protein VFM80_08685 [Gracilimonas sp.]|uniref:hypothetical protein n=1 Tax=Gracilimonas sp. TaxID=1974203 RepID=UPI002DB4954A|nr:hypothetical protein [Gracilimonas sp.]
MKNKVRIGITLVGLIIGGIAYWFQPYNQMTVLGLHIWLIMGVGAFLSSIVLILYLKEKPLKIAQFVSFGVVLAVLARIIFDITFWDSTSHNLAPFEIIIAGIVTFPSAIAGGYLGLLFKNAIASNEVS